MDGPADEKRVRGNFNCKTRSWLTSLPGIPLRSTLADRPGRDLEVDPSHHHGPGDGEFFVVRGGGAQGFKDGSGLGFRVKGSMRIL